MLSQWDDLPPWQRDNQFILSGYRPASGSFKKSFASVTSIHNESVNIYSHLIPAVIFALSSVILYNALEPRYSSSSLADIMAFSCFFSGVILCLSTSAIFHIIQNHSAHVASIGNKLDYVGIVFLIVGSFVPSIFYGFYCYPNLQKFYLIMVCGKSYSHISI